MTRAIVLQEVRQMRCEELYERRQRRELTMAEAAEMLGVTERTFRRWGDRYEAEGAAGLADRRLGRASARAVPCRLMGCCSWSRCMRPAIRAGPSSISTSTGRRSMAGRDPIPGPRTGCTRPDR